MRANLFEITKEERLVVNDGAADGETVLIADVLRFVAAIEIISRIEFGPLAIPPSAAMKFVAALFQHHVHNGAAVIAELGGKTVVLQLEFLDDLNRRLIINVGVAALSLFRRADGIAIEPDFSSGVTLTVGNEICA